MRRLLFLLTPLLLAAAPAAAQFRPTPLPADATKPAYALFDAQGRPLAWGQLLRQAAEADVVLFGEQHDASLAHWLSAELLHDLFKHYKLRVALGMEMLETDQQPSLDLLNAEVLPLDSFLARERHWPNFETDYRPIVQMALDHQLPVYATNAPRELARLVAREGLDALRSLPAEQRKLLPPSLDVAAELPGYVRMRNLMGGHGGSSNAANLVAAQALKDATMAWRIHQVLAPGMTLLHLNGSWHSDRHAPAEAREEGIVHYLRKLRPGVRCLTLSTVVQEDLDSLAPEHRDRADVVLVIPESFPRGR